MRDLLFVDCCVLSGVAFVACVGWCRLFAACCLVLVVCCLKRVACSLLLYVASCSLFVVFGLLIPVGYAFCGCL